MNELRHFLPSFFGNNRSVLVLMRI